MAQRGPSATQKTGLEAGMTVDVESIDGDMDSQQTTVRASTIFSS